MNTYETIVEGLTYRERHVAMLRFAGFTLGTIARDFGVTPERIRQIEAKAGRKIRRNYRVQ